MVTYGDEPLTAGETRFCAPGLDEIVVEPFVIDEEGMLAVPTGPGLGIELDWDGIERLSRGLEKG